MSNDTKLEEILLQLDVLFLTLMVIVSQLRVTEEERLIFGLFYFSTVGYFFISSMVISIIILYLNPKGFLLELLRIIEIALFLFGLSIFYGSVQTEAQRLMDIGDLISTIWFTAFLLPIISTIIIVLARIIQLYLRRRGLPSQNIKKD